MRAACNLRLPTARTHPRPPFLKRYYIMTDEHNSVLYTGRTKDLKRRAHEHRTGWGSGFTSRFKARKLVYYETAEDARAATAREKRIKAGSRQKKLDLIEALNPDWHDLYDEL